MMLVTFAVPFESAAFRRRAISRSVRILHTGIGVDAARVAVECAIRESLPKSVIASGFAGALVPNLNVGEIVCGTENSLRWRHLRWATSSEMLIDSERKREFQLQSGAEVVDMETSAIQEVCAAAKIPLTVLRVISDCLDTDLGLPADLLSALATKPMQALPRLAGALLGDNRRFKAFLRLVSNGHNAQHALAEALEYEIQKMHTP